MKIKEAIHRLREIEREGHLILDDDIAIYMAITALQKISCETEWNGEEVKMIAEKPIAMPVWISIKDRLPEEPPWDAKWVLVWFGDGSEIHTEAPVVGKYNNISDTWYVLGKTLGGKSDIMKVTHWMPLPEPPSDELQEDVKYDG